MSKIAVWQGNLPANRKVAQELARQMGRMELVAEIAKGAMNEVSDIHGYGVYRAATALATGEMIKQAAGGVTPEQQAALQQQGKRYLEVMGHIAGSASAKIALSVDKVPLEDTRTTMEKVADWWAGH